MAKPKKSDEQQADLFPVEPVIGALAVTEFRTSGAEVKAILSGVTNVNDVARLDTACWQKAVADWLVALHLGDLDMALNDVKRAYVSWVNLNGETHRETPEQESGRVLGFRSGE